MTTLKRYVKASRTSGNVGIWWYYNNQEVWAEMCPADEGQADSRYIQFSSDKNHFTEWNKVVNDNVSDITLREQIRYDSYKSLPRGRVIFDLLTQSYIITCGSELKSNLEFKRNICDAFEIPMNRTDVEIIPNHYYVYKKTGNAALDEFEGV